MVGTSRAAFINEATLEEFDELMSTDRLEAAECLSSFTFEKNEFSRPPEIGEEIGEEIAARPGLRRRSTNCRELGKSNGERGGSALVLSGLPADTLFHIVRLLNSSDMVSLSLSCKALLSVASDPARWDARLASDWPAGYVQAAVSLPQARSSHPQRIYCVRVRI